MNDKKTCDNISEEEMEKYTEEARKRWGNTEAFKQSEVRVKKLGEAGLKRVAEKNKKTIQDIADLMKAGKNPKDENVQKLIAEHYDNLRAFYEPNLALYRGLAEMYVADERFKEFYEKTAEGLAEFMKEGMLAFCETQEKKG